MTFFVFFDRITKTFRGKSMIDLINKHYKNNFNDSEIRHSLAKCLVMSDSGFAVHRVPKITDSGFDMQLDFNKSYSSLLENMNYEEPFNQKQMLDICSSLFTIMFDYRLFTSGTGFESRFKTPERMSQKMSSFWYAKHMNRMIVPAEIYEYNEKGHRDFTIPVSLSYDFMFNADVAGIQHTFHTPTKFSSTILGTENHQELIIDFSKIGNDFRYHIKIISLNERKKPTILFMAARTCHEFDEFLNELILLLKRELFNINYKAQYEAFTGVPISFDDFDVSSLNMLFDMTKI